MCGESIGEDEARGEDALLTRTCLKRVVVG